MKRLVCAEITTALDINAIWDDLTYRVADTLLFEDSFSAIENMLELTKAERSATKNLRSLHRGLPDNFTIEIEVEMLNLFRHLFAHKIAILVNSILDRGLIAVTFRNNHTGYHVYELELTAEFSIIPECYFDHEGAELPQ
jgi:hypothetical protein